MIVTGANRGIGAALVRELLKHKPGKIYAAARKVESLPDFGDSRIVPLALDITSAAQIAAAVKAAPDAHILINNAGVAHFGGVTDGPPETITSDMDVNYYGTLNVTRAFIPVLEKNGHGLIANVSSVAGLAAFPALGGYSASKAALHALTQSARAELASRNIRVLGIYPGPIDTDMAKDIEMEKASAAHAAQKIAAGLVAGEEYIFPDPMSQEWGALWRRDPIGFEHVFAGRVAPDTAKAV